MPAIPSPTNKVTAGALAGAFTTIIVFILGFWITIPAAIAVAILTVVTFLVQFFVSD